MKFALIRIGAMMHNSGFHCEGTEDGHVADHPVPNLRVLALVWVPYGDANLPPPMQGGPRDPPTEVGALNLTDKATHQMTSFIFAN